MSGLSLSGLKIGRWLVLSRALDAKGRSQWNCVCDCGTHRVVASNVLQDKRNKQKSCGCWRRERIAMANTTHGLTNSPTWSSWQSMVTRCTNPNSVGYEYWGGRGITICKRWLKFENFHADMGDRPAGKTLDRFPNKDGNYEPGNCRWATPQEQADNRSPTRKCRTHCKRGHELPPKILGQRARRCVVCKESRNASRRKSAWQT